ncbi:MAG: DUF2207 domain-containing protein [Bifidobacteriaceae bacterium]|nr:DUF2207 domain-containing protein [Bifidobacteriaceae bacterium]
MKDIFFETNLERSTKRFCLLFLAGLIIAIVLVIMFPSESSSTNTVSSGNVASNRSSAGSSVSGGKIPDSVSDSSVSDNVSRSVSSGKSPKFVSDDLTFGFNERGFRLFGSMYAGEKTKFDLTVLSVFAVPALSLALSIFLRIKYGKSIRKPDKNEKKRNFNFYPPKDLSVLSTAFFYKGFVRYAETVPLLIDLANRGYIKIVELPLNKRLSSRREFKIVTLQKTNGLTFREFLFLLGLIECESSVQESGEKSLIDRVRSLRERHEIFSSDLDFKFYETGRKILYGNLGINSEENEEWIFNKSFAIKRLFIRCLIVATFFAVTIPASLENFYHATILCFVGTALAAYAFCGLLTVLFKTDATVLLFGKYRRTLSSGTKIRAFFMFFICCLVIWPFVMFTPLLANYYYLAAFFFGIACIIGMYWCMDGFPKRTSQGFELLDSIEKFREFLEAPKKKDLERLTRENPNYFAQMLPFAYVLGIKPEKWLNKFNSLLVKMPDWYESANMSSDFKSFKRSLPQVMMTAAKSMTAGANIYLDNSMPSVRMFIASSYFPANREKM